MQKYEQTVHFKREINITAKNAAEANRILEELISSSEFHGDVVHDGYEDFEDEPVECPDCKGCGAIGEGEQEKECEKCNGDGSVPFVG
jgi:hypothetical protein